MIKGIEHTGIACADSNKLAQWYLDMFPGSHDAMATPEGNHFVMFADGSMIEFYMAKELCDDKGNQKQGVRHLAFTCVGLEEERDRFLAAGVKPLFPPRGKAFFFYDPEGNVLHFVEREKPFV